MNIHIYWVCGRVARYWGWPRGFGHTCLRNKNVREWSFESISCGGRRTSMVSRGELYVKIEIILLRLPVTVMLWPMMHAWNSPDAPALSARSQKTSCTHHNKDLFKKDTMGHSTVDLKIQFLKSSLDWLNCIPQNIQKSYQWKSRIVSMIRTWDKAKKNALKKLVCRKLRRGIF